MDFVIQDGFHDAHDDIWLVYSVHHVCPVCVACIAEVLEDDGRLSLQKKPALSELLRLLSQQPADILQIFMHEERLVWHLLTILIGNLQLNDDTYLALSIETTLKLIQQVKSEDLVTCIMDAFSEHVQSIGSHGNLLPHVTLLGKMVQYLPALAHKLLSQYGDLLQSLGMELCRSGETTQSAVAYIFIFLCEAELLPLMSPRLHQLLQEGLLQMLSTAKTESIQINALGLLKKLLEDDVSCRSLVTLRTDGCSLLAALKKLLLSKRPVLQISVVQALAKLLEKPEASQYGTAVLESDITEFLFEGLHTQNTVQIESILTLLQKLAKVEKFYKRCHAVYGIESILHAMSTALELKTATVLREGFVLMAEILNRQQCGIPLFINSGLVRRCLGMLQSGLEQHQSQVYTAALSALTAMLRKDHLLLPVPLSEIGTLVTMVTERQRSQLSVSRSSQAGKRKSSGSRHQGKEDSGLKDYLRLMVKVCQLAQQCQSDERSVESNFAAPGSADQESSLEKFLQTILCACDDTCIPAVMVQWDKTEDVETHSMSLELLSLLYELQPAAALDIVYKLTSAGFLGNVLDACASQREVQLGEACARFLRLAVASCQSRGLLPTEITCPPLSPDTLPWRLDHLAQAFAEEHVSQETIEAYLLFLYLCFRLDNKVVSVSDLLIVLTSTVDRHISLQELSPLCKKHYLYLFIGANNQSIITLQDVSPAVRFGLQQVLGEPWDTWYSHDVSLLQWAFSYDALAASVGHSMVDAYLSHTREEVLLQHLDDCSEGSEGDVLRNLLLNLCDNWAFLSALLRSLASLTAENVGKIVLLLEWRAQWEFSSPSVAENMDSQMFSMVKEVLHDVFLKNYPEADEHNIIGLLQVLLLLMKDEKRAMQYQIDVKILYHVVNRLSKADELSPQLDHACLLTLLAALSSSTGTEGHVCALVLQNEGVVKHLQECYEADKNTLHCIACDILSCLLHCSPTSSQGSHAVTVVMTGLMQSVCECVGERQVAGLNLLAALFGTDLRHSAITVQTTPSVTQYTTFLIYLQQMLAQEFTEVQEAAAECFSNMISHLNTVNPQLGTELLRQPWNNILLDVILDRCKNKITTSTLKLLTVFASYEAGCQLIRSNPTLLRKLETVSEHLITAEPQHKMSAQKLLGQVAENLGQDLPVSVLQKLKEQ